MRRLRRALIAASGLLLSIALTARPLESQWFLQAAAEDGEAEAEIARENETEEATETAYDLVEEYETIDVSADAYVLIDVTNDRFVADKDMLTTYRPASTTKILTALIVLEEVDDLEDTLTFSHTATVTNLTKDSSTLTPKAQEGEEMTVKDALYGMMLCSGNECANALAEYVAGSNDAFALLMNEKAKEIGCRNSHFTNPSGLDDDDHYTCAYDLALIFLAAMQNDTFMEIDSTAKYTIPATNLCTTDRECEMGHKMINGKYSYAGVVAGKTGQTELAKRVLVTLCDRGGTELLCVIMHAEETDFYDDTATLLTYGYNHLDQLDREKAQREEEWATADSVAESVQAQIESAEESSREAESIAASIAASEAAESEAAANNLTKAERIRIYEAAIFAGCVIIVLLFAEFILYFIVFRKKYPAEKTKKK